MVAREFIRTASDVLILLKTSDYLRYVLDVFYEKTVNDMWLIPVFLLCIVAAWLESWIERHQ